MKYFKWLKWAWIIILVATIIYPIYNYIENSFSWVTIVQLIIVLGAGPGLFYPKPPQW